MEISCSVDTSGLQAGLAYASQYTKRSLPQMINTSAYWIAVNAKNNMPYVTVEKIDKELGTITTPKIGKRGGILSQKYAKNKIYSGGKMGDRVQSVPLAVLIVQARSNPGSNYNQMTRGRYKLPASPFKDRSRAEGRAAMVATIDRMIKSRHSSSKFLLAGWIPAIQLLAPFAVQKFRRGAGPPPLEGASSVKTTAELGTAKWATEGSFDCFANIENKIGYEGVNAESFNQALIRHGLPGLQAAVDREGIEQAKYALKKYDAELTERVNKFWK